jgi:fatty-acyl-CoA synthase
VLPSHRAFLDLGDRIASSELAAREATLRFGDLINIQFTSGTTGSPKGRRSRTTTF